jgi:hypothetical protein
MQKRTQKGTQHTYLQKHTASGSYHDSNTPSEILCAASRLVPYALQEGSVREANQLDQQHKQQSETNTQRLRLQQLL